MLWSPWLDTSELFWQHKGDFLTGWAAVMASLMLCHSDWGMESCVRWALGWGAWGLPGDSSFCSCGSLCCHPPVGLGLQVVVPPEDEEVAGKHLSAALVNGHNRGCLWVYGHTQNKLSNQPLLGLLHPIPSHPWTHFAQIFVTSLPQSGGKTVNVCRQDSTPRPIARQSVQNRTSSRQIEFIVICTGTLQYRYI